MRYTEMESARGDGGGRVLAAFILALAAVFSPAAVMSAQGTPPQPTTTYPAGQGAKVTGIIVSRLGDTLVVRDDASQGISWVTLNGGTKITSPTGFLNLARKSQDATSLIPGLIVKVNGSGDPHGYLAADRISFHKSAMKVASQINAGQVELKSRALANSDSIADAKARGRNALDSLNARVSNLDAYDVKDRSVVTFASGSATLDESAKATLDNFVSRNRGQSGYLVQVDGHADATGGSEMNQRLSQQRADAVVAYLTDVSSVPVRRIPNPRGLGTARPVATNATSEGRAQNRRVEVSILVNRGLSTSR